MTVVDEQLLPRAKTAPSPGPAASDAAGWWRAAWRRWRNPLLEALIRLPLIAVSVYILWVSADSLATLAYRQYPLTSWESSFIVQGEALRRGDHIYHYPPLPHKASRLAYPDGHANVVDAEGNPYPWLYLGPAANMYGPALPHLLSWIFHVTGPTLPVGRLVTLGAVGLLAVLSILVLPRRGRWSPTVLLTVFALLMANHLRARAFFSEIRPDVLAIALFAVGTAVLWWCHERRRFGLYPLGLALMVVAFLFKQTVAPLTAVPLMGVLLTRPPGWWKKDLWLTLLCPMVVLATVQVLKHGFPVVYYYAFFMPTQWRFDPARYWYAPWNALVFCPILLVGLALWAMLPGVGAKPKSTAAWWLLAATGMGLAAASVYFSKRGGSFNSYLVCWIPGSMLMGLVTSWLVADAAVPRRIRATVVGLILPVALLGSTFGVYKSNYFANDGGLAHGSDEWRSVIDLASRLPGKVISPEDPTITMFATGWIEGTLQTEIDAVANERLPEHVRRELITAEWVVDVNTRYSMYLTDVDLWRLGFDPVDVPMWGKRSNYRLWKRINGEPEHVREIRRKRRRYDGPAVYHENYEPLRAGYLLEDAAYPDEPLWRPGWTPPEAPSPATGAPADGSGEQAVTGAETAVAALAGTAAFPLVDIP